MKNCSSAEVRTSRARMKITGKTTPAKGVHNNYNEYKEFHEREVEAPLCTSFMQKVGMSKIGGMLTRILDSKKENYHLFLNLYPELKTKHQ